MTQDQAFEAVRQANPLPTDSSGADGFLSMTALLDRIDERNMDMQTQERSRTGSPRPRDERPRWLVPALAGALVVIIGIALGALLLTGGSNEPDVIEPAPAPTTLPDVVVLSPLEVTNLYNQAVATGDWTAIRELYADTAEQQVVLPTETLPKEVVFDRVPRTPDDWDNDGLLTGFDGFIHEGAWQYAAGTTTFLSCSQVDDVTAACAEVWEGFAFRRPDMESITHTLTIVDGVITTHVIGVPDRSADPILDHLVDEYRQWVSENRPELEATLFDRRDIPSGTDARWPDWPTPDTAETHRELVAEWQAQR